MGKLTPELRKVLKLQYPDDIAIEVRGEIVHFKDIEENWKRLAKGLGLEVFKEEGYTGNWVLYNQKNFKIAEDIDNHRLYLKCISEENLEMPINCSSCHGMFSDFEFKNKDTLKNFDTSGIKDMSYMFCNCNFPNCFSLGDKFDTSKARNMRYMFSHCNFPDGFSLGDKFDTSSAVDMISMFWNCKFPNGFSLGDKFDTSNVRNMSCMFEYCILQNDFSLDEKFNIGHIEFAYNMFRKCVLPEGKKEADFGDFYHRIVEWLKSRNSNKTSNTNFFQ